MIGRTAASLALLALAVPSQRTAHACTDDEPRATIRFNVASDRLYLEGSGCITPSDIYAQKVAGDSNLSIKAVTEDGETAANETGYWIFTSDVYVYTGVKLELHKESGCSAMRLKSDDTKFIELRAHGGWLSMLNTELSSWDEDEGGYQTNYSAPRSYVTAISETLEDPAEDCLGHAKNDVGEARMDIINSEVHHLGYHGTEAYGITYKVRGFCKDLSNEHIFDSVNVRGDIRFSNLHHNYFGMYSYGHQDGLWEYNLMHHNAKYGFDPHDDSDNLRIHNNVVWENGDHGIIASKRCNDVSIQNNVVYDNLNAGIMLHRSSDSAIVRNNTISGSGDACIAIFESFEGDYSNNTCIGNKYGIRWSVGGSKNKVYDNIILQSTQYGIYMYEGSDSPEASDGLPSFNIIADNYIEDALEGLKMGDTVGNEFSGNVFVDTADLRFRNSSNVTWTNNVIPEGVSIEVSESCFSSDSDIVQVGGTVC